MMCEARRQTGVPAEAGCSGGDVERLETFEKQLKRLDISLGGGGEQNRAKIK